MGNRPKAERSSAPAIWVGLVVLALLVLTATLGRPPAIRTAGGAGWLPADGHRQRFDGPGALYATEWALDSAAGLIGAGPTQFFSWLELTELDWQSVKVARRTTVRIDPSGKATGRSDDLFSLTPEGVRAEVVSGFDGGSLVYSPGRLDLPDNLAAGHTWVSEGAVLVMNADGTRVPTGYRAEFSAASPGSRALLARGCVVVTMQEWLGDFPADTTVWTWCRQEGVVDYTNRLGHWQLKAEPAAATLVADPPFDFASGDRLRFEPRRLNQLGVGTTLVSPVAPPGILPDGTAVFANSVATDVLALRTDLDPSPIVWRARPGVRNSTAATFGALTVVANVDRRLVAYGPAGEWVWDIPLPDLAVVAPVRLGDAIAVATVDGSLALHDLATGAQLWRQRVDSEIRAPIEVAGDRLLVVDQGGELTCFDATGTEQWSADVGRVENFVVSAGPDPVVVVPRSDSARVTGLGLADGSRRWRAKHNLNTRDAVALDGAVVLRDGDETFGIDPATGALAWRWAAQRTFAAIGSDRRLLLLGTDRVFLLDDGGRQVAEWPVAVGDPDSGTSYLVAASGRVLVYGPGGAAIGVVR